MKIEIGESLMLSWLRHAKNCQVVQLNWKPSINSWELHNENELDLIMKESQEYFSSKYGLDLFKKNSSCSQLLQQGEIDALGLEINGVNVQSIYCIDVAFHESGLNYGSKEETIARVVKKMIRTALMIYGYFNLRKAEIIFATPKLYNSIGDTIVQCFEELNHEFALRNLEYTFTLISNGDFRDKIFNVVTAFSKSISDTSELFMRSIQMYNLFVEEPVVKEAKPKKEIALKENQPEVYNNFKGFEEMKIGALVKFSIDRLIINDQLTVEEVARLTDERYSKKTFNIGYPVLKERRDGITDLDQREINGYSRYYSNLYTMGGKRYFLCNDWYENKNRSYFTAWLNKFE